MDELEDGFEPEIVADDTDDLGDAGEQETETLEHAPEVPVDDTEAAAEVVLSDGTSLTLDEVEKGYLRQQDYSRKTAEVAEERTRVETARTALRSEATNFQATYQRFEQLVSSLIPPEPQASLARTNPAQYVQMQAERQQAIAVVTQAMSIKQDVNAAARGISDADMKLRRDAEDAAFVKAMPAMKDATRRAAFEQDLPQIAKDFGFSAEEMGATVDHRVWRMAHYARIGMKAEANQKAAARRVDPARKGGVPQPAAQGAKPDATRAFNRNPSLATLLAKMSQ